MSSKAFQQKQAADQRENRTDQETSRLVHHIGPVGTGLFPGWGPKL
jgi:hypothetical protein